jgi:hypothetical protein
VLGQLDGIKEGNMDTEGDIEGAADFDGDREGLEDKVGGALGVVEGIDVGSTEGSVVIASSCGTLASSKLS